MKERIENLLRVEGLTSSKFADEIGVQRSSISHILSGRNNPSLELIQKILSRYRNISADWLISGKGEMFKSANSDNFQVIQPVVNGITDPEPTVIFEKPTPPDESKEIVQKIENQNIIEKKHIERILVFFSDKTFEEYSPHK